MIISKIDQTAKLCDDTKSLTEQERIQ